MIHFTVTEFSAKFLAPLHDEGPPSAGLEPDHDPLCFEKTGFTFLLRRFFFFFLVPAEETFKSQALTVCLFLRLSVPFPDCFAQLAACWRCFGAVA